MKLRGLGAFLAVVLAVSAAPAKAKERVIAFIGDSTTGALYSPPGFPKLVGELLHVRVHNLAVRYPPSYSTRQALLEEVPAVPPDTTDVVVFLGVDDLRSIGDGNETLQAVKADNERIIAALRQRGLHVYELTIRDYTHEPAWTPQTYDRRSLPRIPGIVAALNTHYRATPDVTVIGAASWTDVYTGKWTSDGIHFLPAALKRFASRVARALTR